MSKPNPSSTERLTALRRYSGFFMHIEMQNITTARGLTYAGKRWARRTCVAKSWDAARHVDLFLGMGRHLLVERPAHVNGWFVRRVIKYLEVHQYLKKAGDDYPSISHESHGHQHDYRLHPAAPEAQ